jgi:hypothetical protein
MAEFHAGRYQYLTRADGTTIFADWFSPHVNIVSGNRSDFFFTFEEVYQNLDKIRFSSFYFEYLTVLSLITFFGAISLPQRNVQVQSGKKGKSTSIVPYNGVADYVIFNHNLGKTPVYAAWDLISGRAFSGVTILGSGSSKRILITSSNANTIFLREIFFVFNDALPQTSISIILAFFNAFVEERIPTDPNKDPLLINASRCIFGKGKFDTDLGYIYKDDTSPYSIINRGGLVLEGSSTTMSVRLRSYNNGILIDEYLTNPRPNTVFLTDVITGTLDGNTFNIGYI